MQLYNNFFGMVVFLSFFMTIFAGWGDPNCHHSSDGGANLDAVKSIVNTFNLQSGEKANAEFETGCYKVQCHWLANIDLCKLNFGDHTITASYVLHGLELIANKCSQKHLLKGFITDSKSGWTINIYRSRDCPMPGKGAAEMFRNPSAAKIG